MTDQPRSPFARVLRLALGVLDPPPGRGRIVLAVAYGLICHAVFAVAVLAMIVAMFFGLSESLGRVPAPWHWLANAALIAQFPLAHSVLLSRRGRAILARLTRRRMGKRWPPPPTRSSPRCNWPRSSCSGPPAGSSGCGPRARPSGRSAPPMPPRGFCWSRPAMTWARRCPIPMPPSTRWFASMCWNTSATSTG